MDVILRDSMELEPPDSQASVSQATNGAPSTTHPSHSGGKAYGPKKAAPAPHCFVKKFQHLVLLFLPCDSLQDLNRTSLKSGGTNLEYLAPELFCQPSFRFA